MALVFLALIVMLIWPESLSLALFLAVFLWHIATKDREEKG